MTTRNARASALGFALAALVVLPAPDGALGQSDRQQLACSYAGSGAAAPVLLGNVIETEAVRQVVRYTAEEAITYAAAAQVIGYDAAGQVVDYQAVEAIAYTAERV